MMKTKLLLQKTVFISVMAVLFVSCGKTDEEFDATGTFEAVDITVSSEGNGKIMAFDILEGQDVVAGEQLGVIDSMQLYLSKLQLKQSLASLRSSKPDISKQIAGIREQISKQKSEKERVENLLKDNAATSKQLDDINSSIAVLESQLAATHSSLEKSVSSIDAQISALKIQIAQIDDQLSKCVIKSPVSGTVLAKYAEAGELVTVGRPLFNVANIEKMYLRAYLTLGQLSDVKLGQKVKVFADFGGGNRREYAGTVTWISEQSEFTPKSIQTKNDRANLVYAIKIAFKNDGYVKIGMYGQMEF